MEKELKRGWTTGSCATAATKSACNALLFDDFLDPVEITLPNNSKASFVTAKIEKGEGFAIASVIKDAGDDPDVTHGALISAKISFNKKGGGIIFKAGEGVGIITREGLPFPPNEPAINPVPRQMMKQAIKEISPDNDDFIIEISVENGAEIAKKTLNPRLGIIGGISILGTRGIVIPFSCSAWIHSIYRGIDVAKAAKLDHIIGSTGNTSEKSAQKFYDAPEIALIDMGDFVGGMLKYVKKKPFEKVTIAGGVGKITKLAQGMLDVHSKRGSIDLDFMAKIAKQIGANDEVLDKIKTANNAANVFAICQSANIKIGDEIAKYAFQTCAKLLNNKDINVEILIFNREGEIVGQFNFAPAIFEA